MLQAELDGREEVGSDPTQRLVGDPSGKGEAYVFGIDGDTTTLCYVLTVENIQLVPVGEGMASHINEGLRDTNGLVVAALAGPEDGDAGDCLTEGEAGKFPTGEAGIVQRILNSPEQLYINVHNPMNLTTSVYSSTALELFWDRSGDDGVVVSYNIYRDGALFSASAGNSFYTDS